MKKKKYYIIIFAVLFILGSAYRFVQLNKDLWGEELYTEVNYASTFNINGINFEIEQFEILENVDDQGSSDLKFFINLYKHGEITSEGFHKGPFNIELFYTDYPTSIILNISDKKERIIGNYVTVYDEYAEDNLGYAGDKLKFAEVQRGERDLGEKKENVTLRFRVDKDTMKNIYEDTYQVKLVFPKDSDGLKFNFIKIHMNQLLNKERV
ncbi:hypothetical protein NSA47_11945 [Irregularibacter muris]|uniref:Uncharacterized protein n=1 Tax=Irregularibacter muris TaxID=1796619 RepID=A0AAE3L495_9FIRM|nr:hypothetical protein [Irregularibacter muris]MCR1899688.1 hypothetical protein [Irregularibacter muris]